MKKTVGILMLIFLSGCQVMSEKECRSADWYQVGFQDGTDGEPRSRIEDIAQDCAKAGVTPDRERYFSGRDRGLVEYCTQEHGFELGKDGSSMNEVCPPESAREFERAWHAGREIYDARRRVDDLESKQHRLEDELSKAKSDEEKHRIREELSDTDSSLRQARDSLRWVESRELRE